MRRKSYIFPLILLAALVVSMEVCIVDDAHAQGNVGIGTTSPNASALLDLTSRPSGLLVPRMTHAQKVGISSPANGLLVFQIDSETTGLYSGRSPNTFWYYNGTTSTWMPFPSEGWLLTGNSGTSPTNNFVGTIDSVDWVIRTHDTERVRVYAGGNVGLINNNNVAEELRFISDSFSRYVGFKADTQTTAPTYNWPLYNGDSTNWILTTNGFGVLTWKAYYPDSGGITDTIWTRGTGTKALVGHGRNFSSGAYSISSGFDDTASGTATVVWGEHNSASGYASVVAGGYYDTAKGNYSDIGGGSNNSTSGAYSSVVDGQYNSTCSTGTYAVVVGGNNNEACGNYATILGGDHNTVNGNYSLAYGSGCNVTTDNTFVYYSSSSAMKVGIGTVAPAQALDVVGNLKFSGALMPNGLAGTTGNLLASTGTNSAPVWDSTGNFYWRTWGNTATLPAYNYLGTTDAQPLVFRTNATERMRILSTGQIGINTTTPAHQLHSVYSGPTTETAAIFAEATAATTNQAVGAWGNASGTGTGSIGVLATGNTNTTAGTTNPALQVNDGEFDMGRTTQAPSYGTDVEAAASGTAYSQQGPSGIVELALNGGNLSTTAPNSGVFQNLGLDTINNRYCASTSIVLVSVLSKLDDGSFLNANCTLAEYFVDVDNRSTGSFSIRVSMIPTTTNATNYSTSDKIRVGYTIVNPGR